MMKVLIVDDEPKLREGLKSILPWTELGYQVVGTGERKRSVGEARDVQPGFDAD